MSDIKPLTMPQLEALAKSKKLVVVVPLETELILDIDADRSVNETVLGLLREHFGDAPSLTTISKHGNIHIYIALPEAYCTEARIAMQAALGSDAKREMLSILSAPYTPHPTVLFETKAMKAKVDNWRKRVSAR